MNKKTVGSKDAADKLVKNIRRRTSRKYSAEEKIRIVLTGLRGEESIAALCRREGIAERLYYKWSKEFLEAGKRRLSGDTERQATSPEVKDLCLSPLKLCHYLMVTGGFKVGTETVFGRRCSKGFA